VIIMNAKDAVCRINIDSDGDLKADCSFAFVFSKLLNGVQTGQAGQLEPADDALVESTPAGFGESGEPVDAGPCLVFVGVRSDPFFADAERAFHDFRWTGADMFAGKNSLSIALDVPDDMVFGDASAIGVWAATSVRRAGALVQVDRGGHSSALTDDVFAARMAFLTNGRVTDDGLEPHDDLQPQFPFLGPPHAVMV
jgi:hypothetical protein